MILIQEPYKSSVAEDYASVPRCSGYWFWFHVHYRTLNGKKEIRLTPNVRAMGNPQSSGALISEVKQVYWLVYSHNCRRLQIALSGESLWFHVHYRTVNES